MRTVNRPGCPGRGAPRRYPKIKRIVIKGVTAESHLLIRLIRSCMQRDSPDMHHCVADAFCRHPSACTSGRAWGRFLISQSRHSSFPRREWATCKEQAWEDRRGVHGGGFDFNAETQRRGGVCGNQPMGTVPVGIGCVGSSAPRRDPKRGGCGRDGARPSRVGYTTPRIIPAMASPGISIRCAMGIAQRCFCKQ